MKAKSTQLAELEPRPSGLGKQGDMIDSGEVELG